MGCVIRRVTDRAGWRAFHALPREIYRDDPLWVPPVGSEVRRLLDARRNPYYRDAALHAWVAYRDGAPVARTIAVTHAQDGRATFGFFEAHEDAEAVRGIFDLAAREAAAAGATRLCGPFNPSPHDELGVQVTAFDRPPTFFQPHNPPGYPALLAAAGFEETHRLHTRRNADVAAYVRRHVGTPPPPPTGGRFTVRDFSLRHMTRDLGCVRQVFNDAFAGNDHFQPAGHAEYVFAARHLKLITRPSLVQIVEHCGDPVGVLQCALDVNPALRRLGGRVGPLRLARFLRERRRIGDLVVFAVGVKRAWQGTRVFKLVFDAMCRIALHYRTLETTWISADNHPVAQVSERLGLQPDREFALYARPTGGCHA